MFPPSRLFRLSLVCSVSLFAVSAMTTQVAAREDPVVAAPPAETGAGDETAVEVPVGRARENVVQQAQDAFGTTIGRESIGIYTAGNVRGFSALAAGNARIDGLYFDQVAGPSSRIRRSIAIKVGLSSLRFPFPAPTGVVDYGLIKPGAERSFSSTASADSYKNASLDFDFTLPLAGDDLAIGGGGGVYRNDFVNGAASTQAVGGVAAVLRPTATIEIRPFWTRTQTFDNTIGPSYSTADGSLPPPVPQRRFFGQDWVQFDGASLLYGVIGEARPAAGWSIEAGFFRSAFLTKRDAFILLNGIAHDGEGRYLVFTDPTGKTSSNSGEVRVTRYFAEGPRQHRVIVSARGRHRRQLFGGSDVRDFGPVGVGEQVAFPEPQYSFGEQSRDRVEQLTVGVAYSGRWEGIGEISAGLSRSDYRKSVSRPGLPIAKTEDQPLLYNAALALDISDSLVAYAGYARGLEESGVAPQSALNRNEALPAILTRQLDAGVRWAFAKDLRLTAGVFEVEKPYFNLNAGNLYTELGTIRSRGVEVSLSGTLADNVRIVAGGVFLDPDVTGEGVALGRVGRRPVGLPKRKLDFNADWRTPVNGLSLDLGVARQSARPATTLNTFALPGRALVDIGGRYRFRLGDADATLRVSVTNVFEVAGYNVYGSGTYDIIDGRVFGAYLAADF